MRTKIRFDGSKTREGLFIIYYVARIEFILSEMSLSTEKDNFRFPAIVRHINRSSSIDSFRPKTTLFYGKMKLAGINVGISMPAFGNRIVSISIQHIVEYPFGRNKKWMCTDVHHPFPYKHMVIRWKYKNLQNQIRGETERIEEKSHINLIFVFKLIN